MGQVTISRGWNMGYFSDGTAGAPSVTFGSDTNTGIFRAGADQLSVTLGGTERVLFSSDVVLLKGSTPELAFGAGQDARIFRGAAGQFNLTDGDATPDLNLNVAGAPTLSTCGDGALATGSSNSSGRLTGTTQTACTLTFSASFGGNSADCFIENLTANRGNVTAASATAFTVSNLTAGDDFMYWCPGR
jgi:hypothetical protein